ncbi:hypothetical protein [Nocardia sp. NPDC047654]|uniref:hypothetical protein n=1 Tax=Nocardia sp. NPDC047654 TaxID=3364314 RepID=UPI003712CA45
MPTSQYLRMRTWLEAVPFFVVCFPLVALAKQQIPRLYGLEQGVGISPARLAPILLTGALVVATGSRLGDVHEHALLGRRFFIERAQFVLIAVALAVPVIGAMRLSGVPFGGVIRAGFDTALFFGIALLACVHLPRMMALGISLIVSWSIQTLPWWWTFTSGTWTDMRGFSTPFALAVVSLLGSALGTSVWLAQYPQVHGGSWRRLRSR